VTSGKIGIRQNAGTRSLSLTERDQQERSIVMGNVGKKDKGNKEQRKKPKLNIKEKRKQKNEKKNK
jgi:hypothetical protein